MRTQLVPALVIGAAISMSACGSGGGSSPPPPGPPPPPPPPPPATLTFTSATAASTPESRTAPFYTVTTTSTAGNIQFQTAAGADAARFIFEPANVGSANASGTLRFVNFPDFEAPADANGDNVYEYQFRATDASGVVITHSLQITVTNVTGGFRVREIYAAPTNNGFNSCPCPANIVSAVEVPDGSGRLAVIMHGGYIFYINPANRTAFDPWAGSFPFTPMLDVSGSIPMSPTSTNTISAPDDGLLGLAYSPNFATDRTFYIYMHNSPAHTLEVRRYQVFAGNRDLADPATGDVILSTSLAGILNNGGMATFEGEGSAGLFTFDNNGMLLIGTGDGGSLTGSAAAASDPSLTAQNTNSLLGKVLRIDVSSDAFPGDASRDYAIPAGNAYPGGAGGLPEIWALGLHRPKGNVDRLTGDVWIADPGVSAAAEINRIPVGASGPINFGWSQREGTRFFRGADSASFTSPLGEVIPIPGQLAKAGGALVYRGPSTLLQGQVLFNGGVDLDGNNLYSAAATSFVAGATLSPAAYTIRNADFYSSDGFLDGRLPPEFYSQDSAGNAYLIRNIGRIFRIEAAD
jgi:hypothetical protein